jgi:5-methylcytosine-specific restriction protein A
MAMYLLTWNPKKWPWDCLDDDIKKIQKKGYVEYDWSCINTHPENGDLFFIMMVNTKNNGIFCSGIVDSLEKDTYSEFNKTHKSNKIYGKINVLLNPKKDNILTAKILKENFKNQRWDPQQSGIIIKDEIQEEFKKFWIDFLNNNTRIKIVKKEFLEGNIQQRLFTFRERDGAAREECLNHYGYTCQICKKSLEKMYGEIGKYFIHVHHIKFVSSTKGQYKIDPINDLIPVCPNCHSMLHIKYKGNYLCIDDLKNIVNKNKPNE